MSETGAASTRFLRQTRYILIWGIVVVTVRRIRRRSRWSLDVTSASCTTPARWRTAPTDSSTRTRTRCSKTSGVFCTTGLFIATVAPCLSDAPANGSISGFPLGRVTKISLRAEWSQGQGRKHSSKIRILCFQNSKKRIFKFSWNDMSKKRRKCYQSFRWKSIKSLAYTVRSETTNNYIYVQNYIKLLIKIWL